MTETQHYPWTIKGYEIVVTKEKYIGIKCLDCDMTSYHPKDIEEKYCGNCHKFHETKTCSQCKLKKRLDDFYKTGMIGPFKDSRRAECKECTNKKR